MPAATRSSCSTSTVRHTTASDLAPELDSELRPVVRRGHNATVPVGSTAVRDAIERYSPEVGLHGHIHESKGRMRIGRSQGL